MSDEPCNHQLCHEVGDGTCHFTDAGWITNSTPAVKAALARRRTLPNNPIAVGIRSQLHEEEVVAWLREVIPNLDGARRKEAEDMLEFVRKLGFCGDPVDPPSASSRVPSSNS